MQIVFEPEHFRSAAYDGETRVGVAEIEDTRECWVITHTEVDPAYGGQGIARRLIEGVVAEARRAGKKIVPLCSYADKMMTGKEEYRDVL
ncbi:GNAT family N-acetyltransferase [Selenomonas sp. oral taxon 892]|uniref:GNAT family N-acetyltransferase n=1 Tax=Selenomonas sp. oral taxon 892 TaxID=1321785 RepID=UPI00041B4DA5|nr:GNAT family N-acetyltransferase [Selenomonas sp. oral taxon 892]